MTRPSKSELRLLTAVAHAADPRTTEVFEPLGYVPTEKQAMFHAATAHLVVFGGARGGGKSVAVLMESLKQAVWRPGLQVLVLRRTLAELRRTLLLELARYGFAEKLGARWNGQDMTLTFENGSQILFGYLESMSDCSRYQGASFGLLCVDEATLIDPNALDIVLECLRSGDLGKSVIGARYSCNPGGPGHSRIKSTVIDPTEYGRRVVTDDFGRRVVYIPAKCSDNPHLGPEYAHTLDAIPDANRRAAMRDGNWDAFGGQVFGEWNRDRHIIPRDAISIPQSWQRYCGIDWGWSAPACALWAARDGDGRLWLYREIYVTQTPPETLAAMILGAQSQDGQVIAFVDPSVVAKPTGGLSVYEKFGQSGLGTALAANERIPGWLSLHAALAEGPLCQVHQLMREQGKWDDETCPRLHVLDGTCPNLVRTLPALAYDKNNVEDVDTDLEDHASDCARYICHSLSGHGGPVIYADLARADEPREQRPRAEFRQAMAQATAGDWVETERPDDRPAWSKQPATSGVGATQRSPFARAQEDNDESD
jgi:hypothetical protein